MSITPIPNIGDRVRLVLVNDSVMRKGPWKHLCYTTERLIGSVVRMPSDLLAVMPNSFAVMGSKHDVHIIRMYRLLSINGERVRGYTAPIVPNAKQAQRFVIAGSKVGITYTVECRRNGVWVCSCVGFAYRRTCRHIGEGQRRAAAGAQGAAPPAPGAP